MDLGQVWEDINNLNVEDLRRIGTAPKPVRVLAIVVVCLAVAGLGSYVFIKPRIDQLERAEFQEPGLKKQFDDVQNKAANLGAYKAQLEEMRRSFGAMLRQLPDTTDIESLLVDLSQTSVASGLDVQFFKPEQEVAKEFYAEYPIKLSVTGKYHEFGQFISGLAALPRIVTLQDIDIRALDAKDPGGELQMNLTAVTYRYLDENEIAAQEEQQAGS
jgi:type IV pilus assembly protein PilO